MVEVFKNLTIEYTYPFYLPKHLFGRVFLKKRWNCPNLQIPKLQIWINPHGKPCNGVGDVRPLKHQGRLRELLPDAAAAVKWVRLFICIIIIIIILVVNGVGLLEVEGALRIAAVAKNWNARRPKMMNMEWGDIRLMDIPPKRFSNESLINTNIHTNDWRFPPLPLNDAEEVVVLVSATNAPLATSTMEARVSKEKEERDGKDGDASFEEEESHIRMFALFRQMWSLQTRCGYHLSVCRNWGSFVRYIGNRGIMFGLQVHPSRNSISYLE